MDGRVYRALPGSILAPIIRGLFNILTDPVIHIIGIMIILFVVFSLMESPDEFRDGDDPRSVLFGPAYTFAPDRDRREISWD